MTSNARPPHSENPTTRTANSVTRREVLLAALLPLIPCLVFVCVYVRALDYAYAWTDISAIGERTMLRPQGELGLAFQEPLHRIPGRGAAARQNYYRPLQVVMLSWVEARFGPEPRNFRIACLVVGCLTLGSYALLARRFLGGFGAALFAALFVALHPVGIGAYVWIAGISAAMCALFTLAALGLALASLGSRRLPALGLGSLSLIALVAALLSKERAAVEPALLFAAFATARQLGDAGAPDVRSRRGRAAGLVIAHLLVTLVYFLWWRPRILGSVGAGLPPVGGSAATQILSAMANWPAEMLWLFFPLHSSTSDVIRVVTRIADPMVWLGASLALGSLAAWWFCLRFGRPVSALGIAWIWLAYLPTAGFLPMLHATAERYLFLSAFGAALLLSDLGPVIFRRAGRVLGITAAVAPLVFLAQRTSARIPEWRSNLTLFQHEVEREPAYREGYFLVANEFFQRGRYAEAADYLRPLLSGAPEFEGTSSYSNPLSLNELACSTYLGLQRYEEVLELERSLERTHAAIARLPTLRTCVAQAHNGLGRSRQALDIFHGVAAELGSASPPWLFVMIARTHLALGERAEARKWLREARAASGGDPSLAAEIRSLSGRLRNPARSEKADDH